ncbi:hypothetical protein C9374_014643 [Naegleria lovaniensis]|uniref:ADP-ribosylation factor n=1 Tax=Naegleria lovaniensis TaxID=51637 RepID=A0AA88KPB2_NAELO|nr:uncharacterized protein C9374_014643 [Naegleria lovaniensis]KAG2389243.1 hypothetical protein C9374_014643 [Naegleria lovaniensis]
MGQASHKHQNKEGNNGSSLANPANASKHSSRSSNNSSNSSSSSGHSSNNDLPTNNNNNNNNTLSNNNNNNSKSSKFGKRTKKKQAKAVMVGLDHAGKTSIMLKLKHNKGKNLPSTVPTLGFNVEVLKYKRTVFTMFDIGGFFFKTKQLAQHYFEKNQAVIIVVDSSDRERFDEVREMIHVVTDNQLVSDCKILIYFNKQDIEGACSVEEFKKECLGMSGFNTNQGVVDSSCMSSSSSSFSSSSVTTPTSSTSSWPAAASGASTTKTHYSGTIKGSSSTSSLSSSTWTCACIKQQFTIQPCSAKTGEGLFEGLDWLSQNV